MILNVKKNKNQKKTRKEYAKLFEEFYSITDQYILHNKKQQITKEIIKEVSSLRDNINDLDEQKIDKIDRYCNIKSNKYSFYERFSKIGIIDKETTKQSLNSLYSQNLLYHHYN